MIRASHNSAQYQARTEGPRAMERLSDLKSLRRGAGLAFPAYPIGLFLALLVAPGCMGELGIEGSSKNGRAQVLDGGANDGTYTSSGACAGCPEEQHGIGGTPFNPTNNDSDFVTTDSNGALVMDHKQSALSRYMWVADTDLPGVVKIDLTTMAIVGRYRTGGSNTSRTTVNALGEAFIGSRSDGIGTKTGVTKILPDGKGCPDRNNDGVVTTSTGPDDVLPFGQDECVEWHVETEGDIRGLAAQDIGTSHETVCKGFAGTKEFDPKTVTSLDEHYVWVGGIHGKVYKLDAKTGKILLKTTAPVHVYGAALSGDGKLWLQAGGGGFGFIDTKQCKDQASCDATPTCTQTCTEKSCPATCDSAVKAAYTGMLGGYGITVDYKQRVWRSGHPTAATMRYDPNAPADKRLAYAKVGAYGGGIAADANGWVWGASQSSGVVRVNADTLEGTTIPAKSKGIAVDGQGHVFAVQYEGYIHLIEPGQAITDNKLTTNALALKGNAYAYSDMTGIQTRLAAAEPGWYRNLFNPCTGQNETPTWHTLKWDVEAPTGTWIMFNVRTADTPKDLKTATWSTVACIAPPGGKGQASIAALSGKLVEAEVRFAATGDPAKAGSVQSARIKAFSVVYQCIKVD